MGSDRTLVATSDDGGDLSGWRGQALVVGHGGIGRALAEELRQRAPGLTVLCAGRRGCDLTVDLSDDGSLRDFSEAVAQLPMLRIVLCTAGLLHAEGLRPEKRLQQVNRASLERSFSVNAWGPLLLAKAVEASFPRDRPVHFASLSARVGSIGDNRLGGWYSYRAAKAAQNQLLHTLALEWRRRLPRACLTLLHPGTTETALSEPFQAGVPPERLFSPERAAGHLLDVLQRQRPDSSGAFLAWDGCPIPW